MAGGTAGFFFALLAVAASRDASVREAQFFGQNLDQAFDQAPLIPTDLQEAAVNSGRYAIVNEAATSRNRMDVRTGTDD